MELKPESTTDIPNFRRRALLRNLSMMPLGVSMGLLSQNKIHAQNSIADSVQALTFDVLAP
jgi:hypothetical protein